MSGAPDAGGRDPRALPPVTAAAAVSVRPANAGDLARIWELVLELADYERFAAFVTGTPERLGELLFGGKDTLEARVAEHAGRSVGYMLFYMRYSSFRTRRRLWLEDLFVEPAARGTGAGRALMQDLARTALARGCERVDWDVLDWNQLALDFYRRQGATPVAKEWTQFGMDEAALHRLAAEGRGTRAAGP